MLTPGRAVLAGLAISQLCAAGTSFVIFWTATGDSYREILSWLMGSLAGTTWLGIYRRDGETLQVCDNAADPARPRPTGFDAKPGSGAVLVTFERATP